MFENVVAPDAVEVIHRCVQSNRSGNVRRPGLEPVRGVFVRRLEEIDAKDHLSATLPRRHRFEQLLSAIQHADAGWSADFVARESKKITADMPRVQRAMPGALSRVHERHDTELPRPLTQLSHRIHRPKRVRNMHHREQFDLLRQKRIELAQVKHDLCQRLHDGCLYLTTTVLHVDDVVLYS